MKTILNGVLTAALLAAAIVACNAPQPATGLGEGNATAKPKKKTTTPTDPKEQGDDDDDDDAPRQPSGPSPARKCMDKCVAGDAAATRLMDTQDACVAKCGDSLTCFSKCRTATADSCQTETAACEKLGECDPQCADLEGTPSPTWTQIFGQLLGPSTAGHCTNCHGSGTGGFKCSSKADCYKGLVDAGLIDPANAAESRLTGSGSPLSWFGGSMPTDAANEDADAASALTEWVRAGAKNN